MAKNSQKKLEKNNAKKIILTTGIAILLFLFVFYATRLIYVEPKFEDYCNVKNPYENCSNVESNDSCVPFEDCSINYQEDLKVYERNAFFIYMIIGLALILISFLVSFDVLSNSLVGSGILLLIFSSIRYWSNIPDIFRVSIVGMAILVLLWIAYKKTK